jgi:hypothetical protein
VVSTLQGDESSPPAPCIVAVDLRSASVRGAQALRLLCLADVARRTLEEVEARSAQLILVGGGAEYRVAARGLGVAVDDGDGPPGALAMPPAVEALVAPAVAVRPVSGAPRPRRTFLVGAVSTGRSSEMSPGLTDSVAALFLGEPDPLALRLSLLRPHPREAITLSAARRHRAAQTLDRWRFKVAGWKEMPVVPAPPDVLEAVHRSLSDALDTGAVLQLLHRMEVDHDVASGAKFSTFVAVDRVLALDLKRMVGRVPW